MPVTTANPHQVRTNSILYAAYNNNNLKISNDITQELKPDDLSAAAGGLPAGQIVRFIGRGILFPEELPEQISPSGQQKISSGHSRGTLKYDPGLSICSEASDAGADHPIPLINAPVNIL